ncbi:DUF3519 domain-containing protein [Helicobacter pylori]|uniref:DUF3519 domain-containing protein n=1 Tax=Helicobacter pylori TaxID=210 RepID=UPI00160206E2|nr:DUF3519 domain-containing protein [Helicobacter pylori]
MNEVTAGAALKYHIKRALERSHSISEFSKNLELSAQKSHFSNNTLKIIEELNHGVKQASEEIKEATRTSNLVKSIREQDKHPFEVIEDKEAFFKDLNKNLKDNATPLPKGMSIEEFKQSLESVENKDRFLEHLETRDNSQDRLKFLSLIEPIIREPHIEIFIKDKDSGIAKKDIKAFKDENKTRLYMLITQDNDTILRTFIPKLNERYMRSHVRDADIIHSFIQPNRTAKSDNALSDVVVYEENPTPKPLNSQEDLLKTSENLNETTKDATKLSPLEQANAKKLLKEQHATTPLKEFGTNYPEFALKPKEALEKLLQEKNGQVAGTAYREDLGGIDFVWGNKNYGLEHILKRREDQAIAKGLSEAEAKEYALNVVKSIPEIIEKGVKVDNNGRIAIEYQHMRVGLNDKWDNQKLENKWVISSYEIYNSESGLPFRPIAQLQEVGLEPSKLTEPNLTTNALKKQDLSPLEQAEAEKLAKLESEKLQSEQEFLKAKEQENKRKEALKKKLEHERGNAGNIESQTKIEVGEDIPTQIQAQIPKSRVRLNEREIYDLDYAIVKAKDLKPSFTTGGTQKRTDMNEEQIKSIAQNFDPKKIFGSGGFEDLPIILHDGQVIAGNHRIAGMLNFTPKSRYSYERAIKEYYHIDLKPDELLVRVSHKRLDNTEINNLAAFSNQGRFNSESDHAIAVLSHYEAKLKELDQKLDADSIYSLKNIVAKNLNFDKATHPNVGDSNLALLMYNMPRTKTQGIELLNRWQKEFSNDIKSYEKVKKMFVDNAGSFHNLIHDMNFPNVSLNAYLSDIMDRSFANLKNYQSTSKSLKDLSEKFYKTSSLEMFEKSDQSTSDISEILGGAIARFARFDDPSKALFEALKSDNIKKGLKEFKIADLTKDMFNPDSKEFKDIDIYDFTHYLLMANREPNENNPTLKRLIEAIKDMQKESEKGIKEASKTIAEKRDYSDTNLGNDEIKALLNNAKIPTSGRDAVIFGKNNLTPEMVEFIHKNNKKMIIEKASNKEIELLKDANFRHSEDVRASLDHEAITHILKRHGVNSVNVRNGESPITYEDIANYRDIVNSADEIIKAIGKGNKENITAFKQINGYAVVVEQAVNRNSELVLKTMYKSNGDYKSNNAYKAFSSTGLNANAKVKP